METKGTAALQEKAGDQVPEFPRHREDEYGDGFEEDTPEEASTTENRLSQAGLVEVVQKLQIKRGRHFRFRHFAPIKQIDVHTLARKF